VAAAEGYVDEIVPPADTRRRLSEALRTMEAVTQPAHGVRNIPL
jgi:acetyl-CoA carboxylase carboxyltransferase component